LSIIANILMSQHNGRRIPHYHTLPTREHHEKEIKVTTYKFDAKYGCIISQDSANSHLKCIKK
jgi:hypothetical protein